MGIHADKLRIAEDVYELARLESSEESDEDDEGAALTGRHSRIRIRKKSKDKGTDKSQADETGSSYGRKFGAHRSRADKTGTAAEAESASSGSSIFQKRKNRKDTVINVQKDKKGSAAGTAARKAGTKVRENIEKMVKEYVKSHAGAIVTAGLIMFLILLISSVFSSCQASFSGSGGAVWVTTYTADDEDIKAVERTYVGMEDEIRRQVETIEVSYPGYDEYNIISAETGHDPYKLASLLTVLYEDYSVSKAGDKLNAIFNCQYQLIIDPVTEIRTRTVTTTSTDEEGNETTDTYEEEYEYHILNVELRNNSIDAAVNAENLNVDQLERYRILNETYGNKREIFGDNVYAKRTETADIEEYDIPAEALTDASFARMIQEAEKYLGYPYVWGGSSPSTSFDCSGFVSWVVNHSGNGWDVGRQTANGLLGCCNRISLSNAKPGDLIFFEKTYNTSGASHVGIYVGSGMMIHCGNPIQYTSINTAYWQSHYLCCGRLK